MNEQMIDQVRKQNKTPLKQVTIDPTEEVVMHRSDIHLMTRLIKEDLIMVDYRLRKGPATQGLERTTSLSKDELMYYLIYRLGYVKGWLEEQNRF